MEVQNDKNRIEFDPAAWVDRHGDVLYRCALARLRDKESAEEVVQETFVAALRHQAQFAGTGSEGAWLVGILKRKIIDHIRQRSKAGVQLESPGEHDLAEILFDRSGAWREEFRRDDFRPLDSLEREDFWRVLRSCMEGLPSRQADVFALRTMEQRSTEEICKDLEITASTVWVLLHRARTRLANCMRSHW
jgi:RNA polymerase sigma-70 factor (ECF subfamily)